MRRTRSLPGSVVFCLEGAAQDARTPDKAKPAGGSFFVYFFGGKESRSPAGVRRLRKRASRPERNEKTPARVPSGTRLEAAKKKCPPGRRAAKKS